MARKRDTKAADPGVLEALGIVGCGSVEPVILAALAQRDPLLLIGPHGTGKSLLLTRLSAALGLELRHYNASLLSFDDLVGYPLPDNSGSLRYIQTPATIWGAQAVFFDEISRCRPEVQNKLFSIIHERRVQGLSLDRLVYRWSAMNPPASEESAEYAGSEPLDRALADRFAYVVELPGWNSMTAEQHEMLILTADDGPSPEIAAKVRSIVDRASHMAASLRQVLAPKLATYVRVVTGLLHQAGIAVSPRRAVMLFRNICGVHAARVETLPDAELEQSVVQALNRSFCQPAFGEAVSATKVIAAHREAWKACRDRAGGAFEAVLLEPDPLRRGLLALLLPEIPNTDFSTIVADCLTALPAGARHAFATSVLEGSGAERLVAAVAEQCAELYAIVATPQNVRESVGADGPRHRLWQRIVERLGKMDKRLPETRQTENLLIGLFAQNELATASDLDAVMHAWSNSWHEIRTPRP